MANNSLFRKKSLEHLSSPEELDRLIVVSRSGLWLSLLAVAIIILASLSWGWFGRIDDQIIGEGIVVRSEGSRTLYVYGSPLKSQRVQAGMKVRFFPSFVMKEVHGFVSGTVAKVRHWPLERAEVAKQVHGQELADLLTRMAGGPPILITVDLDLDSQTPSGLKWSGGNGPNIAIPVGSLGRAEITIERQRPLALVVPWISKT